MQWVEFFFLIISSSVLNRELNSSFFFFNFRTFSAMFQTPLMPAVPPSHSPYPVSPGPPVVRPGPLNLSQPSPVASMQPSPPMPVLSNSNSQSSPSPGAKDASSPQPPSALTFQQVSCCYFHNNPLGQLPAVSVISVHSIDMNCISLL